MSPPLAASLKPAFGVLRMQDNCRQFLNDDWSTMFLIMKQEMERICGLVKTKVASTQPAVVTARNC